MLPADDLSTVPMIPAKARQKLEKNSRNLAQVFSKDLLSLVADSPVEYLIGATLNRAPALEIVSRSLPTHPPFCIL